MTITSRAAGLAIALVVSLVGCEGMIGYGGTATEGRLEVVIATNAATGLVETEYTLATDDGQRIRLELATPADHLGGSRVAVIAAESTGDRLVVESIELLDPVAALEAAPATVQSPKRVAVLLVNFRDWADQPVSADAARSMVFTGSTSVNAYFQEISYGWRTLVGKSRADGDVFGWYTVSYSWATCDYATWGSAARNAAYYAGVDLSGYDHVIHYFAENACNWSGVGEMPGKYSWINQAGASTIAHELGHNFGVHHANTYNCTSGGQRVPIGGSCTTTEYGDPFDVMGASYRHMNAYNKGRLGYYWPENTATATADGIFTVTPLEGALEGIKALRVARDSSNYYYVEFRQPSFFDSFSPSASVVNGILVRLAPGYTTLKRSQLLDMTPSTSSFSDAALAVGKSFADTAAGITITLLDKSPAGARVSVDLPGGTGPMPTPPPPPASQLVANPGFESGNTAWTTTPDVIDGGSSWPSHSGGWKAWLNGWGAVASDTAEQAITIPSDARTVTLKLWLRVITWETTTTGVRDRLFVEVRDGAGAVLQTLRTYSNLDATSAYVERTFDLSAYRGTVRLRFRGLEDAATATMFLIDDVTVNVTR